MKYLKKWLRPILFAAGGAGIGLAYYFLVGCRSGSCAIASDPVISSVYMAVVGLLVSGLFGKECDSGCNM